MSSYVIQTRFLILDLSPRASVTKLRSQVSESSDPWITNPLPLVPSLFFVPSPLLARRFSLARLADTFSPSADSSWRPILHLPSELLLQSFLSPGLGRATFSSCSSSSFYQTKRSLSFEFVHPQDFHPELFRSLLLNFFFPLISSPPFPFPPPRRHPNLRPSAMLPGQANSCTLCSHTPPLYGM